MTVNVIEKPAPISSYVRYANRPVTTIFLHHTAGQQNGAAPTPTINGSWHRRIDGSGNIINEVPLEHAASCVLMTDKWRPPSVVRCPDGKTSDANYCGIHYEIQYAPQAPYNESPNAAQYEAIIYALQLDYQRFGPLPIIGHGEVQSDKLPCEPCYFLYNAAGIGPVQPGIGRFFTYPTPPIDEADMANPADDETIKGWLESRGMPVNMDTGLMQVAAKAFRQGDPPHGNWRGPAMPAPGGTVNDPGEYDWYDPDGVLHKRHRFSAGIAYYNTATGGSGWVETIAEHPEVD